MEIKVCFLGGARYEQPLDATSEKKFRALKSLGEFFVIGFSQSLYPRSFKEHAYFYLLPQLPLSVMRYAEMFLLGPPLACWLIFRHGVRALVAQSPYEGFAAALAKRIAEWLGYRVALVVESHGDFHESLFLYRRIVLQRLYRFLMHHVAKFVLRHADVLRAVSNSTEEQFKRSGTVSPIIQFPAWTDIDLFLQAGTRLHADPVHNVVYAGVLSPIKGVHHLINAFAFVTKTLPNVNLLIIGREAHKAYAAELKEQVRRNGLYGRVHFLGEVSQAELASWMRRASVFILPSASEGLPRVVLEAMATGIPVIASKISGIQEIVQDGSTGLLVEPGNEALLAERLLWLLEHAAEARQMGRRARDFARGFSSTEAYLRGYQRIFDVAQMILTENDKHAASTL